MEGGDAQLHLGQLEDPKLTVEAVLRLLDQQTSLTDALTKAVKVNASATRATTPAEEVLVELTEDHLEGRLV